MVSQHDQAVNEVCIHARFFLGLVSQQDVVVFVVVEDLQEPGHHLFVCVDEGVEAQHPLFLLSEANAVRQILEELGDEHQHLQRGGCLFFVMDFGEKWKRGWNTANKNRRGPSCSTSVSSTAGQTKRRKKRVAAICLLSEPKPE